MNQETISLLPLFEEQKKLDARIHQEHHTNYQETMEKRIMALVVELGELANETRAFKYWSTKGPSAKAVILDEYADGLHFFLSLGLAIDYPIDALQVVVRPKELTTQFLDLYEEIIAFRNSPDRDHYYRSFSKFISLIPAMGYTREDVIDAYKAKLKVNYERQNTHY